MIQKIDTLFNIQDLKRSKMLISIFPLHDFKGLYYLKAAKKSKFGENIKDLVEQNMFERYNSTKFTGLIAYKNYFGEKMCIMQAFFTFYTVWFAVPAFISVILCIYQLNSQSWDNIECIFFAFCISLWSTIFIERWKRKEYHIQQQWGMVTEKEQNDTTLNPDFIGYNKFSWTNYDVQKESKTLSTILIIALNITVSLAMIILQIFMYFAVRKNTNLNNYLTGIVISFISGCINVVYKEMASRFVIWENHKYLKDKDGSFMLKIVIFSTINTNLPFVYSILYPDTQTEIEKPLVQAAKQRLL